MYIGNMNIHTISKYLISARGSPTPQVPDTVPAPISDTVNAAPAKWWHVSDERILEMLQAQDSRSVAVVEEVWMVVWRFGDFFLWWCHWVF